MECYPISDSSDVSLINFLSGRPDAVAKICGSKEYPQISGRVRFYQTRAGVLVYARVNRLPYDQGSCNSRVFAFHIHGGPECSGDSADAFSNAGTHFNPEDCTHPYHAGDLPPLFGNDGFAVSVFLTNRFRVRQIIGRTVIIHSGHDDFTTDPSGNAGSKIACGIIKKNESLP